MHSKTQSGTKRNSKNERNRVSHVLLKPVAFLKGDMPIQSKFTIQSIPSHKIEPNLLVKQTYREAGRLGANPRNGTESAKEGEQQK